MADEIQSIDFSIKTNGAKSAKATLVNLVKSVGSALNGTTAEVDKLSAKFDKATAAVEKQKLKVDELQQKLTKLSSGEVAPKSTSLNNLNKEFDKTIATIEKLEQKEDELKAKQAELLSVFPKDSGMAQQLPEYKALESELATVKTELEQARSKSDELANSLQNAQGTATQAEIQKTTTQLDLEKAKLTELQQTADTVGKKISTSINPFKQALENAGTTVTKFGARIMGLVKRVFVFTVITKGLRAIRDTIGAVLMSDSAFVSSLNQLQAALWTAFAPIMQMVVPWLKVLVQWVTNAMVTVGQFIALITGKSYSALQAEGKALKQRTEAYKASGNAAEKAGKKSAKATEKETKALNKQLASFDELQTLQTNKDEGATDAGGADVGGAGGGGISSDGAGIWGEPPDFSKTQEQLQTMLALVGAIAGGMAAWKITSLLGNTETMLGYLKNILGLALLIAGLFLEIKNYSDAWVNGLDWNNFIGILAGAVGIIGGISLMFGSLAAACAGVVLSIAAVVLAVKDIITNGLTLQNMLLLIIGLVGLFAAVWSLATFEVAIVVAAIVALIAIFVILWNKSEAFREFWINLWETIKTTAVNIWENYLQPTLQALGDFFVSVWNNIIKPTIDTIIEIIQSLWENHIKPFWEDHLQPALEAIGQKASELWEQVLEPVISNVMEILKELWDNVLKPIINWVAENVASTFETAFNAVELVVTTVIENISTIIDGLKTVFSGIVDFITGVFKGDWENALNGLATVAEGVINTIIGLFEDMINFIIKGINSLFLDKINKVADKLGAVFGKKVDLNLHLSTVTLPRVNLTPLAQGTVVPPNKEFAAILGDNKKEPEIVSPISTMEQAVENVLSRMGYSNNSAPTEVVLKVNDREFGRAVLELGGRAKRVKGNTFVKTKLIYG